MFAILACSEFVEPVVDDLGPAPRCAFYERWERDWSQRERDMQLAISAVRGMGTTCGDQASGANASRVTMAPTLRCAAREHAANSGRRSRLSPTGADGRGPARRAYDAGYEGIPRGELMARGDADPAAVLAGWLDDPQQCAALLDRELDEVGVGLYRRGANDEAYWVVSLGTRR